MKFENIKVGMRVIPNEKFGSKDLPPGTVKYIADTTSIAVEHDREMGGHVCGGKTARHKGWWYRSSELDVYELKLEDFLKEAPNLQQKQRFSRFSSKNFPL